MKRTPMRRGKGLKARPPAKVEPEELRAMASFKAAIGGMACVVCGKTEREALEWTRDELGYALGLQAHHGIRQQVLRRLGLPLWDERLAVPACSEPCHRRHTQRRERIRRSALPARFLEFVQEFGLELEMEREYPT